MQLTVRLFAMLKEAQRSDRITVELPAGATAGELRAAIARGYPALAPLLKSSRVTAALKFVSDTQVLDGAKEIALIPPVSGG